MRLSLVHASVFAATLLSASLAHASTITFSGAPFGPGFTGPVTEAGFTYSLASGSLYINTDGNPGNNVEPNLGAGTGGTLRIVSATAGLFDFAGIDVGSAGSGSISVSGYDGATLVGTDSFAGANTGLPGTYTRYTSGNLDDLTSLLISLPASPETAIDNVVVNSVAAATPEPSTLALFGTGILGLAGMARRRFLA